jgi:aspartate carbamoyltransferase
MALQHRHLLSIDQLSRDDVVHLLEQADHMRTVVQTSGGCQLLAGRVAVIMFYEPSTRTSSSFQAAMQRLGGSVVAIDSSSSSVLKGETLQDTVRVLSRLADMIVLRHPMKGSASEAAAVSRVPILNAGDGVGEHPSQALLDLFTIERRRRHFYRQHRPGGEPPAELHVTMLGDLKNGRTVHSLSKLLALYYTAPGALTIHFVSPPQLRFPADLLAALEAKGVRVLQSESLWRGQGDRDSALCRTHVLYVTRVQKERFTDPAEYEAVKGAFKVDRALLDSARADSIRQDSADASLLMVMHPLPRVDELSTDLDDDPRCCYWDQVENGVFMRMALLARAGGCVR